MGLFLVPYILLYPLFVPFEALANAISEFAHSIGFDLDRLFNIQG
jgi:hypothetical protein